MAMDLVWTTEKRRVADLIPLDFNPRTITKERQRKLIASVDEFNLVEIPVINRDNHIIAGQRRYEVLVLAGRQNEEIDVRVPNRMLTEAEVKRYMLISNTHAGEWDLAKLETEFVGIDVGAIVELPNLQAPVLPRQLEKKPLGTGQVVQDDHEEPEDKSFQIVATRGDVFQLNKHRIMCGDSTDAADVKILMGDDRAEMVFTDPPYNVKVKEIVGLGKTKHDEFKMASGEMNRTRFTRFLQDVFLNLITYSKNGSIHYVCMDWKHILEIITAGQIYTKMMNLCVWNKDNGGMGTFYRSKHEMVFVFKNGKAKHINNFELGQGGRYRTNVWDYTGVNSAGSTERENLEEHPTVKPVAMVADAILDCSNTGHIILDLFIGFGTTLIAAEQTDRICYGMELDEKYCDKTIRRYIRFAKQYGMPLTITRNGETVNPEIFFAL